MVAYSFLIYYFTHIALEKFLNKIQNQPKIMHKEETLWSPYNNQLKIRLSRSYSNGDLLLHRTIS